jgi:hypothetical protein
MLFFVQMIDILSFSHYICRRMQWNRADYLKRRQKVGLVQYNSEMSTFHSHSWCLDALPTAPQIDFEIGACVGCQPGLPEVVSQAKGVFFSVMVGFM